MDGSDVLDGAGGAVGSLGSLLDKFIKNKNRQQAKNIALSCAEFILSVCTIVLAIYDEGMTPDPEVVPIAAFAGAIAAVVGITVTLHAVAVPARIANDDVESFLRRVQNIPYLNVLREMPFTCKRGSYLLMTFLWILYGLVCGSVIASVVQAQQTDGQTSYGVTQHAASRSTVTSAVLAMLQMFRIIGDVGEYIVRTRVRNSMPDSVLFKSSTAERGKQLVANPLFVSEST